MSTDPPSQSNLADEQEVSLEELRQAYAEALAGQQDPLPTTPDEGQETSEACEDDLGTQTAPATESADSPETEEDHSVGITPARILEAMLFVGDQANEPLTCARAAELMRGVEANEVPDLVAELNRRYHTSGCPYHIVSEERGYRLTLRKAHDNVRLRFYGKTREARLSQAAIDVLAIVAYRQPLTAEEVTKLRGTPSSHLLTQLVRRQLLRMERPEGKGKRAVYHVTDRFLDLFRLETLDDLPQAEEPEN
jgi:segregation and condensation protein B